MSGPYNNGGYPNQNPYGGAPPPPQYGGQEQQYNPGYPPQNQNPYPPAASPYQQQPAQGYQPPAAPQYGGGNSYGPPANGGFQHGQTYPNQYGPPSPQPPQNQQFNPSAPNAQFQQQGAYGQQPYPHNNNSPMPAQDPNLPPGAVGPDGDRGLMGAMAGGAAGYYGGNKMGHHGIIGALVGAFAGSKAEDYAKGKHKQNQQGQGKW